MVAGQTQAGEISMASKKANVSAIARASQRGRIDTVNFLRDAKLAKEWQASRLYQALLIHMSTQNGNEPAARALLYGGLGFRWPYPRSVMDAADVLLSDAVQQLAAAQLYILTPQMCDVVMAAAQALTLEDLELMNEEDLDSPSGLIVLPHAILVRTLGGELADFKAVSWHTPISLESAIGIEPGVRITTFDDTHGPVQPDSFRQFADEAKRQRTPLPPLIINAVRCISFNLSVGEYPDFEKQRRGAQGVREHLHGVATRLGLDEEHVEGEFVPGVEVADPDDTLSLRFLFAFWRLCEQRIGEFEDLELFRSDYRVAGPAGVDPELRVVRLRRAKDANGQSEQGREWSHRWVVRMHKVRQWYPSEKRHKVIYRGPYIKGPSGKPLREVGVVRALVR